MSIRSIQSMNDPGGEFRRFECQVCLQEFLYDASIHFEKPTACEECEKEIRQEEYRRIDARNRATAGGNSGSGLTRITGLMDAVVGDLNRIYENIVRAELERLFRPDGYVYLLGTPDGGYYKIGRSKNVSRRLRQLKIQLPWPVEVLHTIPCENHRASERHLHRMFAKRRANGEWFALTEGDVNMFRSITRMRGEEMERNA